MPALTFVDFSGLTPRQSSRLLPPNGATVCENALLSSGEIQQIRAPALVHTPSNPGPWLAVHRAEYDGAEKWLAWAKDVDVAVSPFDADTEPRYYWTGDAEPRYAPFSALPATKYALGVPSPQGALTVSPSGGTAPTVSRIYGYTYFTALGEESGISPVSALATGNANGSWAVSGFNEVPTSGNSCTVSFAAGVTTVINDGGARHWLRVGDEITIGGSTAIVSKIVDHYRFELVGNFTGTPWARVAPWNMTGAKIRLYRSAGTVASLQLVSEDVLGDLVRYSAGIFTDNISDADIPGDECISADWLPPPTDLIGIFSLPNGCSVGFRGKKLRLSEPYQPHAWPDKYEYGTDYDIVGAAAYGSTIVAATAGNPYIADGNDPEAMSLQKVGEIWPGLSKRSVTAVADGVIYASAYGQIYVGMRGAMIWTADLFTRREWEPLNPASMVCAVAEGRVFIAHQPVGQPVQMLVIHPGERAALGTSNVPSTELYVDPKSGVFHIVDAVGIQQWDAKVGEFLTWTWASRETVFPSKVNLGAAKIEFEGSATPADQIAAAEKYLADIAANEAAIAAGDVLGAFGSYDFCDMDIAGDNLLDPVPAGDALDQLEFKLFANGKERVSRKVFSTEPFKLPSGFKTDSIRIQIRGNVQVYRVRIAETIVGLRAAP